MPSGSGFAVNVTTPPKPLHLPPPEVAAAQLPEDVDDVCLIVDEDEDEGSWMDKCVFR